MTLQNLNRILDKYELQLGSTNVQQFELLKELSFYNWQKQPQLLPSGNCGLQQLRSHNCSRNFNTEIGLPQKNWQSYPLFDYEQLLFDTLRQHKHVWIKKATGLGITEFMLRYMAWLCTSTNKVENSQMCIVTGPRIELAITLIDRMKGLFRQNIQMQFDTKETVIELNGVHIEAYPSHHLDSMRGLTDVSFIYLDEADFFPPGQQQDARDVSERYIAKSNPWIVMVSTPNAPDGLFEKIEREPENTCLYKRLFLDYKYGLDRIYSREEIERAKTSPSFEREYNLKYLGKVGNVFHALDIEASICTQREGQEMMDWSTSIMVGRSMGIDVAWGDTSQFAIVITQFRNRKVEVIYAETYEKPQMNYIINHIMQLKQRHHITKIYVDGANPEVIRELKSRIGEYHDYYGRLTEEDIWSLRTSNSWQIIPVNFQKRHKEMLQWTYTLMSKKFIKIHPSFHELIVSLRTATVSDEWKLDKQQTSRIRVWVSLFVLGMLGLRPAESGRYLDHRTEGHEFIPPTNPDVAFHILFCTNVPTKDHLICI